MNPKKLVRKVIPRQGVKLAEETYRKGRVYALQARSGFPAKGMRVVAVTGTNGKTTTCCYINEVLKAGGYKTALFTTAVIELNGKSRLNTSHRTVPLTAELVAFLRQAKRAQVDVVILEMTSMALDQHKLLGIPVEVAVMTNLTQDHLDYHGDMESYAAAKARLFNAYMRPSFSVLNGDDEWYEYFRKQSVGEVVCYGQDADCHVRIQQLKSTATGSEWKISEKGKDLSVRTHIPGEFNVYNASAALCVGKLLGLSSKQLQEGVAALKTVPGRMQTVEAGQPFAVLVDYAHTPDALENVLLAAKGIAKNKVLVVFGATGDRDRSKRPIMGEIAARHADKIYLTDDETYTERPDTIRTAVRKGIEKAGGVYVEIPDRQEAIATALQDAKKGDVVVLAGIGHQDTRNMGGKQIPWDEPAIALSLLKKQ
ncbi:MAG TPA: UDP-N-acetylmuramoyl-L-alanyl-D-glutamate--2,6-diaminopimelate ligase [Hymenobacter sp.]|jgi:UDP-N-acetylmuramoyl-L-alanyl-D-glutamate--2,6-diaminopimelate ligase